MKFATHLPLIACLIGLAHAALISPNGLPAGLKPPIRSPRNRTDFKTIFSNITRKAAASHKSFQIVSPRDTIPAPQFFQLTFGPINGANNADGYMGFTSLTSYDPSACAEACNTRGFDSNGPCIFFNIWTAVVNGTATQFVCSMYDTVTDASTATNTGQGTLLVTNSRGYSRVSAVQDGSFQDFTCIVTASNGCPFAPSAFWTRVFTVGNDFILVNNFPAHSGTSSALFFFDSAEAIEGQTDVPSTLTYTPKLKVVPGAQYLLSFFFTPNSFGPTSGSDTLFSVLWNGADVLDVKEPVNSDISQSLTFLNAQVVVTATGNDTLVFQNGAADPHQMYLDDIALFAKFF